MLRALTAELSDPGRFSRAKAYARDGAVIDIDISAGEVRATIQGSRYEPYVASVYVAPSDDTDSLLGLIPDRDELQATCSCPDDGPYGGAFCKHALTALLALADEATIEPAVLARWRTADPEAEGAAIPRHRGSRTPRSDVPGEVEVVDVLVTALAAPHPIPGPPDLPARLPVTMAARGGPHGEDVARVLADALAVLRAR
jgi:uncharacterized Zn finger protein